MIVYLIRRLLQVIPTLFVISLILFGLLALKPGDPIDGAGEVAELPGLSRPEAMKTGAFWLLSLGHVLWTFGSMSLIGHIPAFLTDQGFGDKVAAGFFALAIGISVAGRLSFGVLADRFTKRRIMSSAMILHVLAVFCLFRVDSFGALPVFAIILVSLASVGIVWFAGTQLAVHGDKLAKHFMI